MPAKEVTRKPAEVIERSPCDAERFYFKVPLRGIVDVSLTTSRFGIDTDTEQIRSLLVQTGRRRYSSIHTHFTDPSFPNSWSCGPSARDLFTFICDRDQRAMIIALRDSKTGSVVAYSFTRKTGQTPKPQTQRERSDLVNFVFEDPYLCDMNVGKVMTAYRLQYAFLDLNAPFALLRKVDA